MPPQSQSQTLGEVARRLDEIFGRFETVANELPKTFISREVFDAYKELVRVTDQTYDVKIESLKKRVSDLEDDKKWLYRLIIGAVILAVLGVVIASTQSKNNSGTTPKASVGVSTYGK